MLHLKFLIPSNVRRSVIVIHSILLFAIASVVFGDDEFKNSDTNPTKQGRILSLLLTGQLTATESVFSVSQDNICKLPELTDSSPPANCYEIKQRNASSASGIYKVRPRDKQRSFSVYCDMTTDNGGWTVFQRRNEYAGLQEDFFRSWLDYKQGFGNLNREFWLGNDALSALSDDEENVLRIDLADFNENKRYAVYNTFRVSTETNKYQIHVSGYEGDAGDSLKRHNGCFFSTKDKLAGKEDCPQLYKGGWWYEQCHNVNLNGLYLKGTHSAHGDGIEWKAWLGYNYSLKKTEMKIRPK